MDCLGISDKPKILMDQNPSGAPFVDAYTKDSQGDHPPCPYQRLQTAEKKLDDPIRRGYQYWKRDHHITPPKLSLPVFLSASLDYESQEEVLLFLHSVVLSGTKGMSRYDAALALMERSK